ncbi:hypothetical protein PF005_g3250 [Phytophthora fragariae]|uniref:Uncharacterized protein n=1 Tax=Phytophthora fragariae TaxID=53985 RepID=A0A6A3FLH8_9STRA|nr:hypothetical protein PF003_g8481 [Phytophthora fragariae]KAE8946914.1 hypothetical protein PF009_g3468 [Phytophthora fragariae]KAE9026367.1 hypothetical protein PF011_g2597 [Phytophthora fragariae]KAE9133496.1 hypothetical protein PF010_g2794 [Phytophthora fragariae]KAE9133763.1 hypothetical protein PF007_g3219 [Phytophthora fragariae]
MTPHKLLQRRAAKSQEIRGSLAAYFTLLVLVLMLDVLLTSGTKVLLPMMSFAESYPTRFVMFYRPKVEVLTTMMHDLFDELEMLEQLSHAWDFTAALVTLVCVHQVIESARSTIASRLRTSTETNAE